MSREYTLAASNLSVFNGAATQVCFQAMTAVPITAIEIIRAWASQAANATSNQQRIQLNTQLTAFPTTMTGQAPQKIKATDPVSQLVSGASSAAGTSCVGNTTQTEGAGAKTILIPDAFNVLNGWLWVPTPTETHIETAQSTAHSYGLHTPAAPVAQTNWNFGLVIRELG